MDLCDWSAWSHTQLPTPHSGWQIWQTYLWCICCFQDFSLKGGESGWSFTTVPRPCCSHKPGWNILGMTAPALSPRALFLTSHWQPEGSAGQTFHWQKVSVAHHRALIVIFYCADNLGSHKLSGRHHWKWWISNSRYNKQIAWMKTVPSVFCGLSRVTKMEMILLWKYINSNFSIIFISMQQQKGAFSPSHLLTTTECQFTAHTDSPGQQTSKEADKGSYWSIHGTYNCCSTINSCTIGCPKVN